VRLLAARQHLLSQPCAGRSRGPASPQQLTGRCELRWMYWMRPDAV
jgi:hypothetical protein